MNLNLDWLQAHWNELQAIGIGLLALAGSVYGVARLVVVLTPTPADDRYLERTKAWLVKLCAIVGLDPRQGRKTLALLLCAGLLAGGCATGPMLDRVTHPDGTVTETVNVEATIALQNASIANAQTALNMFITAMEAVRELKGDEWSEADQARYEREQVRQQENIALMREALSLLLSRRDGTANAES